MNHTMMATTTAMKKLMLTQLELPKSLSRPPLGMMAALLATARAAVRSELEAPQAEASMSGILARTRLTRNMAIQLNMMAVMTSFTLKRALKRPGKMPQRPPPIMARIRQTYQGSWRKIAP